MHWSLDDWNRYNYVPGYAASPILRPSEVCAGWAEKARGDRRGRRTIRPDDASVHQRSTGPRCGARAADRTRAVDGRRVGRGRRRDRCLGRRPGPARGHPRAACHLGTRDDRPSLRGHHLQHADHAVRLVAGQVADEEVVPGRIEDHGRRRVGAGSQRHLGRAVAVVRFRAGPVTLVECGVTNEPLVLDGVRVDQRDLIGTPARATTSVGVYLEKWIPMVAVVDPPSPSRPGARTQAAAIPAKPSERAIPPTRARRPGRVGRNAASHQAGRNPES